MLLLQSYGTMNVLAEFMTNFETENLQALNNWMYRNGVPRVQLRWPLNRQRYYYFVAPWIWNDFKNHLF